MEAIKIAVDAGHGSFTSGKRTPPMPKDIDFEKDGIIDVKKGQAIREHWVNVGVAYYVAYYLKKWGFSIVRTGWNDKDGTDDTDTPLWKRQDTIRKAGCLVSVSCHFNAHGNGKEFTSGQGTETLIHNLEANRNQSEEMAKKIHARLIGGTEQKDRGIKTDVLAMCNAVAMGTEASVLCEYAFMTNEKEAYLMGDKNFWKECGKETAVGIRDYLWKKPSAEIKSSTATRAEVIWLQINLRLSGEDVVTTGVWDEQTIKAIKKFWKDQTRRSCTGKVVNEKCIEMLS